MTGPMTPITADDYAIEGVNRPDPNIGGFQYGGGINTAPIFQGWPLIPGDTQGIAIDDFTEFTTAGQQSMNGTEGPSAVMQNGGVLQAPVTLGGKTQQGNDVDEVLSSWNSGNNHMSPYQVDTNITGPVNGLAETMNGNTLQPDNNPQGQYGAATGGGTSAHETVTAYYMAQIDQVQRDYAAAALFASV